MVCRYRVTRTKTRAPLDYVVFFSIVVGCQQGHEAHETHWFAAVAVRLMDIYCWSHVHRTIVVWH